LDITNKKAQGKGLRAYGAQMHEAGMLGGWEAMMWKFE